MAAKEVFRLLSSHPTWFVCSLVLGLMLWAKRRHVWNPRTCPVDLSGKTAIVTGANSGECACGAGRGGTEGQLCQSLLGLVTLGEPTWEQRHLGSHLVPPRCL